MHLTLFHNRYVRTVEQVIIDVLKKYNINGERNPINSGVFVNKDKISAVGITASRWITMHGVALNVINDLRSFQDIVPCGIANPDFGVTTMQKHSHSGLSLEDVAKDVVDSFSSNFGLNIEYVDDPIARLEAMRKTFPDIAVPTPITA